MYKRQLLKDLEEAYYRILRQSRLEGKNLTRHQICDIISQIPAPRIYASPNYVNRLLRESTPKAKAYASSGKQQEIIKRFAGIPVSERSIEVISSKLQQPAPSFYLSSKYIYILLYNLYDKRKPTPVIAD